MGKVAFVFSGQGDQFPGMGQKLPAHTGELVPLAGEYKGYFTHLPASRSRGSAPSITSFTMSAAGS